MQFYNDNKRTQTLFPRLALAITEDHFVASLNAHVKYLNDLVNARVEGTSARKLYYSWSIYAAFFPKLSITHNEAAFDLFLEWSVNDMKAMIDSIVTDKIANEYLKILENGCNEVYELQAMERIARQEKEAAEEDSEEFQQGFEEPEAEFDDVTNEHYDTILSLEKKCNKRIRHGCDNTAEKLMQRVKVLPANFPNESQIEVQDEDVVKPSSKKAKWEENKLAKRKLSKLRLKRQDKSIVDHKNPYDCSEQERDAVYLDFYDDDDSYYSYSSFKTVY